MRSSEPLFRVPPFPAFPSLSRYVALGSLQDAMTRVCRSIDAREGISLVIGPPGTGKSLLATLLQETYQESRDVVLLGDAPIANPNSFGRHVLHQLGVQWKQIPETDLHLALVDHLSEQEAHEGGLLIIVDEAQSLSPEVLEAIRMTTNIMRRDQPRVGVVLCGGPKLDDTLADPALEPLTQRVATRCYLHPLNVPESHQYITESIRACGADPKETITDEAIAAVHHACSGVPRLINQMMTQAIDCAEASGQCLIDERVIDQAWAELQQLPGPMMEEPTLAAAGEPVEFGELAEETFQAPAEAETDSEPHLDLERQDAPHRSLPEDHVELPMPQSRPLPGHTLEHAATVTTEPQSIDTADTAETADTANSGEAFSGEAPGAASGSIPVPQLIREPASEPEQPHQPPESVASLDSPAPLPSALFGEALFGDFEEEEEVIVGTGAPPRGAEAAMSEVTEPLEATLHQEIIGIASQAAEAVIPETSRPETSSGIVGECRIADTIEDHPNSAANTPANEVLHLSGTESIDDHSHDAAADDSSAEDTPGPSHRAEDSVSPSAAAQPVIWLTETEEGELIRDDRDLLVIEEDVEIQCSAAPAVDEEDQELPVSVDFQAMLERMRSGA